jgi:pimeloyl-ACP methyl ester carboxylesterase
VPIHHLAIGKGFPVVMLHGWTLDHQAMVHCLEPVFEKRDGWQRIYVDLPGMGRSLPQPSIQSADDMCAAVVTFIDDVIPNRQFAMCGYSYGALIARGVVHHRRNMVRGLCFLAPVIVAEPAARVLPERQVLMRDEALMSRLSPKEAEAFEEVAVLQGEREWERFRDECMIPSNSADLEYLTRVRQSGYGFTFDVDSMPAPFEDPVLIVNGRQDHVVGFEDAWRVMGNYPRGTFVVLDRAGHLLQIDQPRLFEALVHDWLDRLELALKVR